MIYVEQDPAGGNLPTESRLIYQYAMLNDLPHTSFAPGAVPDATPDDLVVGSVESLRTVFRRLGVPVPAPNYYPAALRDLLCREVEPVTWAEALAIARDQPVFVKSRDWKTLTGSVLSPDTLASLNTVQYAANMPVWISEVVEWDAEFRVYALDGEILAICQYGEAPDDDRLHTGLVASGMRRLTRMSKRRALVTDWGVLADGRTAVVENNDAWAIGAYPGIDHRDYYQILKARWDEITHAVSSETACV